MLPSVETFALASLSLLALGALIHSSFALIPATARPARDALPLLGTEVLIVGTVVSVFWAGDWILFLALLLHAGHTSYEAAFVALRRRNGADPMQERGALPVAFGVAIALLCWAASQLPLDLLAWLIVGSLLGAFLVRRGKAKNAVAAIGADLLLFPVLPTVLFTAAGIGGAHGAWLLLAFLLVETFDSYALLGGKLVGRRLAFPTLSPRKTVEGLLCGAVMLMLTAALGALLLEAPVWAAAGLGLLAAALAIAGDLAASRLKRASGVKDFPLLLPRQGGLLDITDAWIATGAGFVLVSLIANA